MPDLDDGRDQNSGTSDGSRGAGEDTLRTARHRAVAWLSRREYATGEMRQKLEQREFAPDVVAQTMGWLERNDLISNERFSEAFCRRRARQGYGPQRVRMELRQRGVPSALADAALEAECWQEAARAAWQKRFKSRLPESARERAKQQKYLAQRGFSHDMIRSVIR